ncbi:MAG TPA: transcription-repair coupling factor, partial [Xanthomonadaceae bacterium]|nr:transcription-repair coupling factor [Xanthomonadaceae bacterium]
MASPILPSLPLPTPGRQRAWWRAPASPSALAWFVSRAALVCAGPLLLVARDGHTAHQLASDLQTLRAAEDPPIHHFPDWETLPYDRFSPHPDIISQRLAVLFALPAMRRGIVVVAVQT